MARRLWLGGVLTAALGCAGEPGAPGTKGDPGRDGVDGATAGGAVDESDQDWFAVTVDAAQVGKSIHVQTTGLDPRTDTVVDIFEQQGNTLIPLGPNGKPSDDFGLLDELTSVATTSPGRISSRCRRRRSSILRTPRTT